MKRKTIKKLTDRWEALQLHHIDACIFLESLSKSKGGIFCKKYLNEVGYKYRGVISILVTGEIIRIIISEIEDDINKEIIFRWLNETIKRRNIDFCSPDFTAIRI